jgi:hypothetical protein
MNKVKIFISYCTEDKSIMESLRDSINQHNKIEAVVIPYVDAGIISNQEKVIEGINCSEHFISIITENSMKNQWVNQELGYAMCRFKNRNSLEIIPIVDFRIKSELKGFITQNTNIQYKYENEAELRDAISNVARVLSEKHKTHGEYFIR